MANDLELFDVTVLHVNRAKNTLRWWLASLPAKPVSITITLPPIDRIRDESSSPPPHYLTFPSWKG
jgi:hypothetical protein